MIRETPQALNVQTGQDEDHVFISDLALRCSIGIHDHEKQTPQRVVINVNMAVHPAGGPLNDNHDNVVCYETVVDQIRALASNGHVNLVETMADEIVEICFRNTRVHKVRVRVEKPDIIADAASVGIEITRYRSAL